MVLGELMRRKDAQLIWWVTLTVKLQSGFVDEETSEKPLHL